MAESVRHFGYSLSSGLASAHVYFDDVTVFRYYRFFPSTLEKAFSKSTGFKSLWRAFSNGPVIGDCFQRCRVDDSHIRSKTAPFSFENRLVWTGLNTNKVLRYA